MRYGYVEDCNEGINGLFTRVVTPPLLSKIGLSSQHPKFAFIGYKKSILKWLTEHQQIVVELKDSARQRDLRDVTFEISNVYSLPFSPCRVVIRPSKNQDYTEPIPGSPEYFDNTRLIVVESGRKLKDVLPFLDRCWTDGPRARYVVNTEALDAMERAEREREERRNAQSEQEDGECTAAVPFGPSPTYHTVEYGIPLGEAPTYRTIDSVRSVVNSLPRYNSINRDRLLVRAGVPQEQR
ncbi:hypothetical protein K493DRAFT_412023 [Basidiobolus meristosporus CBS 931.73]|uniref:Uncharacterized protein n=1 Tax=Basidiobolus meristosporus CBS 931.73 TaxID=1314790 RepID=A0A1Y1X5Y8_9FUNG|nr:hypothetical protein K493DRAFT_412023 [Basidiobolus meristosporus CBS 931.73]|eukprot:ORX81219.1 hypothetical protein K493DRAFT_412023 [Basidiobolus meristosporus CBS 931.73]